MSDDELRRRLRDIPAPRAGIDADAVVAAAKRRRRPKAIALSSAATVASVLIVAPLAVTGLQLLPQTASQQESSDAGAAESAEQPASGGAPEEAEQSAEDAGEGDTGASGEAPPTGGNDAAASGGVSLVCGLHPASDLGLELAFTDDPAGGSARVEVRGADGAAVPELEVIEVESLDSVDGVARVWAGAASEELALDAGGSAELAVPTAVLGVDACADAAASAPAPVAIVVRGTRAPTAVVGERWE